MDLFSHSWNSSSKISQKDKNVCSCMVLWIIRSLSSRPDPKFGSAIWKSLKLWDSISTKNLASSGKIDLKKMKITCPIPEAKLKKAWDRKRFSDFQAVSRKKPRPAASPVRRCEDVSLSTSPQEIIQMMLDDVWQLFPNPGANLKQALPLSAPFLSKKNVGLYVKKPFFKGTRKFSWEDRFKWFFPLKANDIIQKQGWKQLGYIDQFFAWKETASQAELDELKEIFMSFEVLPGGTKADKLWITRNKTGEDGTFVHFVTRNE